MKAIIELILNLTWWELLIDAIILIFGVALLFKLKKVNKNMIEIKKKSEKAYSSTSSNAMKNDAGNLEKNTKTTFNRQEHEPIRKKFNAENLDFIKYVSLISVLPLMGLLGTVIGLMPGLLAVKEQNFDVLYSSLSTALTSTFIGLLLSIILKIYVSEGPDKVVNGIETDFDEIDRLYEMQ